MVDVDLRAQQPCLCGSGADGRGAGVSSGRNVNHQVADFRQGQGPLGQVVAQQHAQPGMDTDLLVNRPGIGSPDLPGRTGQEGQDNTGCDAAREKTHEEIPAGEVEPCHGTPPVGTEAKVGEFPFRPAMMTAWN